MSRRSLASSVRLAPSLLGSLLLVSLASSGAARAQDGTEHALSYKTAEGAKIGWRFSVTSNGEQVKRTIDLCVASFALAVLAPVFAILAVAVRAFHGSPVLFRQQRAGRAGRPFSIVKFRTMTGESGPNGVPLPDDRRLTRFGRFLRSSSLDELPELWNVVRGDMSLVGPRPLPVSYLRRYTEREARRHEVRPGITGLAQVSGRNTLTWEDRLELDVRYVETRSLNLDFRILARTVGQVLACTGISAAGHATMAELRAPASPDPDAGSS